MSSKARHRRSLLAAAVAMTVVLTGLQAPAQAAPPSTAAALNAMFNNYGDTAGRWAGGDSTASVTLPDGRVVWLFSDTLLGPVNANHSLPGSTPMVSNTMMVTDTAGQLVSTLTGGTAQSPLALVTTGVANESYWVADATVSGSQLQVLLNRYRKVGPEALDVQMIGTALATFALPALTFTGVTELPLGSDVAWGSAILEDGSYTYIYGSELGGGSAEPNFAHLARVPNDGLGGNWQFWTGSAWSSQVTDSARLLSGVGTSFGVQKTGGQYVLVTMEGHLPFNPEVVAYTASAPGGPFTGPISLFTAPEPATGVGKPMITYDARVHPDLAPGGKLLVSYNVNSLELADVFADVRNYRPRFVEVTWPRPAPSPGVPAAPTALTATADLEGSVRLTWQAPAGLTFNVYQRDLTAGQTHFVRLPLPVSTSTADAGMLRNGHNYQFRVTAVNASGEGAPSGIATATATVLPPPAPTGVTVVADNVGRAKVSWSAVPASWNYRVFMRDITAGETGFTKIKSAAPDRLYADIDWLADAHEYEFYVAASNGAGSSPPSAPVRVTVHHSVPPAPSGLTASASADGSISLNWTPPAPDLWYWVYQRDVTAGEPDFVRLPLPITTGPSMTAGYLVHGHEYEYKVTATNRVGEGPTSPMARATSNYPAPGAPSNLTVSSGDGQVVINWAASSTPDVWYLVHMRNVTAGETAFTKLELPVTTCCTATLGLLANGQTYEFKVVANKAGRDSAMSNTVSVTPQVPLPGQVTGLTVAPQGDGSVTLNWTAPGPNLWFNVYQRDVTAGEATFTKLPLPVTSCCTANIGKNHLLHNHVYEYKMAATNAAGEGALSPVAQVTVHYDRPPAPANLRGVTSGDGYIQLDWDAAPSFYWVYYRDVTAGQATFTKAVWPTDQPRVNWGPLAHGHTFEFKVTAENAGGESPASSTIQVTSLGGLPLPPSNLVATAGDGQATLTWTASPTPNAWYWVYQRDATAGQSWVKLSLPITSCCTMTAGYLANGHHYEWKVVANNASGDSGPSNVATARPMPPRPGAPTGLTASSGNGSVTLNWNAPAGGPFYYWIEYKPSGGNWKRIDVPFVNCCSATLGYLTNFTSYQFRVFANNITGDSLSPSNVATATPVPPWPSAPTALSASASDGKVTLTWNASSTPNVYYWVEYKKSSASSWTRTAYPISTCCTFAAAYLMNGVTYNFRLIATNGRESGPSNTATATPWVPLNQRPSLSATSTGVTTSYLWWTAVPNATGYQIEYQNLSNRDGSWTRLAYPVTGTSLNAAYLNGATWYRWRVIPINGAQEGPASATRDVRTRGQAIYSARNVLGDSYSAGVGGGSENYTCMEASGYGTPVSGPWAWGLWLPVYSSQTRMQACNGGVIQDVWDDQLKNLLLPSGATLITMTIGGNDAGFANELEKCILSTWFNECTDRESYLEGHIDSIKPRLVQLYRELLSRAPGADIVIAGYPLLVAAPTLGKCDWSIAWKLSDAEHRMIRRLSLRMNGVIEQAAAEAGVVDAASETVDEFRNHEACMQDEYIHQFIPRGGWPPVHTSSFHPNGAGQQAYVRAVDGRMNSMEAVGMQR